MTTDPGFVPLAEVRRGGAGESWHLGAAVAVRPDGRIFARCGDPAVRTFVRSAAKPFQIVPLLESGGVARFRLDDADLALICASHSGNPEHVERSRDLLRRGDFSPTALRCGAHPPMNPVAAESLRAAGREAESLHNNCSGKHAGQLLACVALGYEPDDYDAPEHPLQRRIVREVERFFAVDESEMEFGIDGCSLPTFRLPLVSLARAYARLADPAGSGLAGALSAAIGRVFEAMTGAPEMVAGAERFTTRLMEAAKGSVLGKEGAEGVYALAVRGSEPLGIAIKIADGGERARDAVVLELLAKLGVLSDGALQRLAGDRRPELRNWRGLPVGEIVPTAEWEYTTESGRPNERAVLGEVG